MNDDNNDRDKELDFRYIYPRMPYPDFIWRWIGMIGIKDWITMLSEQGGKIDLIKLHKKLVDAEKNLASLREAYQKEAKTNDKRD